MKRSTGIVAALAVAAFGLGPAVAPAHAVGRTTPVGQYATVTAGMQAKVVSIGDVEQDRLGSWLNVSVRFKNTSGHKIPLPGVGIQCRGAEFDGGFLAGSTIYLAHSLRAGRQEAGVLELVIGGDYRTRAKAPECKTPAYVQLTPLLTSGADSKPTAWVRIPDAAIRQLNAGR